MSSSEQSSPKLVGRKAQGGLFILAIIFAALVIPNSYVPISIYNLIPRANPNLQFTSTGLLTTGTPLQQITQVQGGYQVPWIPAATGMGMAYQYYRGLVTQHNPALVLQSDSVPLGQNVTFIARAWPEAKFSASSQISLYVFVVSPIGMLSAAYPSGYSLSYISSQNGQPSFAGNYFLNTYNSPFTQNGVRFTWKIPNDNSSIGIWHIYAFIADQETENNQPTIYYGASLASFSVNPASEPSPLYIVSGFLGSVFTVYKIEEFSLTNARRIGRTHRQWLADNALLLIGLVLIAVYLYFVYHLP